MTLEEAKGILSLLYIEQLNKSADCAAAFAFEKANFYDDRCKAIDTVLKALEEQQKEIEEITTENENLTLSQLDFTKSHISKDKIREKIKELGKDIPMMTPRYFDWDSSEVIKLLEELLVEV